ncbi:MAG: superoxide dismutase, Ni [Dehalococcoidia bacterium]|nr:superoxide dismutase, Ni [Dehalococcoidia bacterium]
MIQTLKRLMTIREVHAHCDIPCGIYDPIAAKIAAQTVLKMVVRIEALDDGDMSNEAGNSFFRYVAVKEEHAELCKRELNILSNDYFKPEHLEAHPDLPSKIWRAAKLASANKQGVDKEAAEGLVAAVDEIATIFWATKGVEYSDPVAAVRFGT